MRIPMIRFGLFSMTLAFVAACVLSPSARAQELWTNPDDPSLPRDYKVQGEYVAKTSEGKKLGVQVIALGDGAFQAVIYPGGLPGEGWDGENRSLMDGRLDGDVTRFKPAEGNRKYLAGSPDQFSATRQFPPKGHKPATAVITNKGVIEGEIGGESFRGERVVRKSPTMGAEPPKGAVVLFDGKNADAWSGGRVDEKTKLLNTDGKDIVTKQKFNDYTMHIEFMLPYKPKARGQGRGNSGFYQVDMYEVQVLDSFGLEGLNNECGGIYSKKDSDVNACLPPLQWQTYDVEFKNAVMENGKKVKPARITVKLNGIVIHDDYEIPGKTGGARNEPEGTPGPIKLQGHGNPLQYRNIWIVPK